VAYLQDRSLLRKNLILPMLRYDQSVGSVSSPRRRTRLWCRWRLPFERIRTRERIERRGLHVAQPRDLKLVHSGG